MNALADDAKDKLAKALSKVDDTVTFDALAEIMEAILGPYTESAAAVAATFYDGLREWFGISDGFYAVSEGMRDPYITNGTVNKVMQGKSAVSLSEDMQNALSDQIDYEVRRTANLTIERNCKRDPLKPKWARVPQVTMTTYAPWSKERGVTHDKFLAMTGTCMFCTMLASRGFTYQSAETAGHSHPDCNCRIVPSWDKKNPAVDGYDPDKYYDMWKHHEKYEDDAQLQVNKKVKIDAGMFPEAFTNTKQRRENFDVFINEFNAVTNGDEKVMRLYSSIDKLESKSDALRSISELRVSYTEKGHICDPYFTRDDAKISKIVLKVPKMTERNINGTFGTSLHELGHYIDVLSGTDGLSWSSTKYAEFLKTNYTSLPAAERRAAARARVASVQPKGAILDEMRKAEERYRSAIDEIGAWYEQARNTAEATYKSTISVDGITMEEKGAALKNYMETWKELKSENDVRVSIAQRDAFDGVDLLEDIYDALNDGYLRDSTVDGVKIYYGHGPKYYATLDKKVEEIWANYCALSVKRPDIIEMLRAEQPELIKSMDKMRDDILGGLDG